MPFCPTCGAPVEGAFCAKCGSAVTGQVPPAQGTPVAAGGLTDNVASALCYLLTIVTGIIFLVLEPYNKNPTIRFHAFQAIFLGVACIAFDIVLSFIVSILHLYALGFLFSLLGLVFFGLWIVMMVTAFQGKMVVLPVIGQLAQQYQRK